MRRATTFDEFIERVGTLFESADETNASFRPRPTDVIISPFAKCGTTWLQQMVHSIRTGGDMDFEDIYEVVPWIDVAIELGLDLDADQRAEPRAFKSHRMWDTVPKGCRYIVSFREPKDAAVSMFRFMEGWFIEPGAISVDEFVERTALDREDGSDYWEHMASWLRRRDDPDVLLLTFEEMKLELRKVVKRVADFMGVAADDDLLDLATHRSSFEFMSANRGPFE
ncbi:MAG: sulfotransferase domain-containing protein, partial [Halobacteriales archaeon]|nr:sulfotransferase domain-containing protein [Halobacteriales archaeon]